MISRLNAMITVWLTLVWIWMIANNLGSVNMEYVGKLWFAGFLAGFSCVVLRLGAKNLLLDSSDFLAKKLIYVTEAVILIALIVSVFKQPFETLGWVQIICFTGVVLGYMNGSEYIPRAFGMMPKRSIKTDK